jgi:hypothetical protein
VAEDLFDRLFTRRYLLPALFLAIVVVALLTPSPLSLDKATRLTSYSVEGAGARGFYQTADRLGWSVSRMEREFHDTLDRHTTYAVLAPVIQPTSRELHSLLNAVREGASLLYVTTPNSEIIDSLQLVNAGNYNSLVNTEAGVFGEIELDISSCGSVFPGQFSGLDYLSRTYTLADSFSFDTVTFAAATTRGVASVLALGIHYGSGRIVLVSQGDVFRNDVLRRCDRKEGLLAMRMLAWLSEPVGKTVVFDEFHHGYDGSPGFLTVLSRAVVASPSGRVSIQLALAAVILLMSAAARPLPPQQRESIERRSPFEHVGALARAYEKVGATRRASRLFVRGLRRRHDASAWRGGSDEKYLRSIAASHPRLAREVELLLQAVDKRRAPGEFIEVGKAVETIERTLSSDNN